MSDAEEGAIVIGGSMAGLLAAHALSNHVDRVVVVERDKFPTRPEFRKGVPQSRHAHVLLARGQELLEHFFPGIVGELRRAGAVDLEGPADFLALNQHGWASRYRPGLAVLSLSRELLEFHVRSRLALSPRVRFREETEVVDLLADAGSIHGVRVRVRGAAAGVGADAPDKMRAQLVVDASGRDSHAPNWLQTLGYRAPRESKIVSFAGYASRYYAEPEGFTADWKVLFFFPSIDLPRGGVLFPLEGGRWLVTLIGVGRDYPPIDEAGFLRFARTLRSPMLHNVIREATPISEIHGYRRTENQLRGYDGLSRWPKGFLVLGDAACAFNPIYGQGMTVCALEAHQLDQSLAEAGSDGRLVLPERAAQRAIQRASAVAWRLATSADLKYPTTEGARPGIASALLGPYVDRLQRVAMRDPVVASAFRNVTHLLRPPSTLLAPGVALRVLAPRRIERRDRPPTETPFGADQPA